MLLINNKNVLDLTVLEEWKSAQKDLGIAPGTITNHVVCVNHFLRYIGHEELCFPNGGRRSLAGKQFGNLICTGANQS
jgi:hypothetical protein